MSHIIIFRNYLLFIWFKLIFNLAFLNTIILLLLYIGCINLGETLLILSRFLSVFGELVSLIDRVIFSRFLYTFFWEVVGLINGVIFSRFLYIFFWEVVGLINRVIFSRFLYTFWELVRLINRIIFRGFWSYYWLSFWIRFEVIRWLILVIVHTILIIRFWRDKLWLIIVYWSISSNLWLVRIFITNSLLIWGLLKRLLGGFKLLIVWWFFLKLGSFFTWLLLRVLKILRRQFSLVLDFIRILICQLFILRILNTLYFLFRGCLRSIF